MLKMSAKILCKKSNIWLYGEILGSGLGRDFFSITSCRNTESRFCLHALQFCSPWHLQREPWTAPTTPRTLLKLFCSSSCNKKFVLWFNKILPACTIAVLLNTPNKIFDKLCGSVQLPDLNMHETWDNVSRLLLYCIDIRKERGILHSRMVIAIFTIAYIGEYSHGSKPKENIYMGPKHCLQITYFETCVHWSGYMVIYCIPPVLPVL